MLKADDRDAGENQNIIQYLKHIEQRSVFHMACFKFCVIEMVQRVCQDDGHCCGCKQRQEVHEMLYTFAGFGIRRGEHQPERCKAADAEIADTVADPVLLLCDGKQNEQLRNEPEHNRKLTADEQSCQAVVVAAVDNPYDGSHHAEQSDNQQYSGDDSCHCMPPPFFSVYHIIMRKAMTLRKKARLFDLLTEQGCRIVWLTILQIRCIIKPEVLCFSVLAEMQKRGMFMGIFDYFQSVMGRPRNNAEKSDARSAQEGARKTDQIIIDVNAAPPKNAVAISEKLRRIIALSVTLHDTARWWYYKADAPFTRRDVLTWCRENGLLLPELAGMPDCGRQFYC